MTRPAAVRLSLRPPAAPANPAAAPRAAAARPACASADASIDEAGFVPIGGIEQWVTITGRRCGNPVLLFLHGGPGNPLSPYAGALFAGWERDYTLVQWDQRGAGRTFGRNPPGDGATLTVQRMADDGLALVEHLATRLGHDRVVLVGGSWGSILGVHMVKARPARFHAYVGFAQIVGSAANQSATYTRVLALAREAGDADVVASLESMGPPPWTNPRHPGVVRRATRRYEGKVADPAPPEWWQRAPAADTPELRSHDEAGEEYSYLQFVGLDGKGMFSGVDLPALGTRFEVPMFFVQGAEDLVTMPDVTRAYVDRITAPAKALVMVPRTGHDPNPAMLAAIRAVLDERVRPRIGSPGVAPAR
jgi:pimeloyl-ACP methyl ester carboxylesterase